MLAFGWVVVSDPESELVCADVHSPEKCPVSIHPCFELELDPVCKWLLGTRLGFGVDQPGLVETVVTILPSDLLFVLIFTFQDIKALVSVVSDVTCFATVPLNSLLVLSFPITDYCCHAHVETLVCLVRNHQSSICHGSDGVGSGVKQPPLAIVAWFGVSNS